MGNLQRRVSELEKMIQDIQLNVKVTGVDISVINRLNAIESELATIKSSINEKTNGLPHILASANAAVTLSRQTEQRLTAVESKINTKAPTPPTPPNYDARLLTIEKTISDNYNELKSILETKTDKRGSKK